MKRKIVCAALFSLCIVRGLAQPVKDNRAAPRAVVASAKGDDSFLSFTHNAYKAENKYVVFNVWNESSPLSEWEKTEMASIKEVLAKKGVDVVMVEWKTEADLKAAFAPYNIEATVKDGNHIRLKSGSSQLNTTSANALYVIENNKPVSLCSGSTCKNRLKYFFGLKALN